MLINKVFQGSDEISCSQGEAASWSEGASLFSLWVGEVLFQVVLGAESGLCALFTFHLDIGQSTFPCNLLFLAGESKSSQ